MGSRQLSGATGGKTLGGCKLLISGGPGIIRTCDRLLPMRTADGPESARSQSIAQCAIVNASQDYQSTRLSRSAWHIVFISDWLYLFQSRHPTRARAFSLLNQIRSHSSAAPGRMLNGPRKRPTKVPTIESVAEPGDNRRCGRLLA